MPEIKLRDYQELGIDQVYDKFRSGSKRVIFWLQTGGGKSVTFSSMIHEALKFNMPVVLCVRRRQLITQASNHLDKWKIPHGVYMANHYRFMPEKLVQICSIDTLNARNLYPHSGKPNTLVLIDESHDCTPSSRKYSKFVENYANNFIVGFTATPFSDNSHFEEIVNPIHAHELRDRGFLVPERTFVPNVINTDGLKTKRGDYDESQLFDLCSKSEIVGNFVSDWKKYSGERPTILFGVNIEHSKMIAEEFRKNGIAAEHFDGKSKSHEREYAIERLVTGKLKILTNVDIFSTGVDIPQASCIQLCRPTQSLIWHLQAIGRGLRPSEGKNNCIVIDNAGNTHRHGTAYKVREAQIEKVKRSKKEELEDISIRACKKCFYIFESNEKMCPNCGFMNPPVERKINHRDGELVEYNLSPEEIELMKKASMVKDYYKLNFIAKKRGMNPKWVYHQLKKKYEIELLRKYRDEVEFPIDMLT